jgi:hypothetical protein
MSTNFAMDRTKSTVQHRYKINTMNDALSEKVRLIQWLLPQLGSDDILAAEVAFYGVRRKADLAIISPVHIRAIEIKGPRDNLSSLANQIADYRMAFLEVDVAVASRFVKATRNLIPADVGIIELSEEGPVRLRKPRSRTTLSREGALAWLHADDLKRICDLPSKRRMSLEELRFWSTAAPQQRLSAEAIMAAYRRYAGKYRNFLDERNSRLNEDDVATLELPTRVR